MPHIQAPEAQRRLAAIMEFSDDAVISKDLDGVVTSWSRGAERLFGYHADEIVGRSITTLFSRDYLHEEDQILERLRRGEVIRHLKTRRRRKDGHNVDVLLTISPMRDEQGAVVGISKIARDLSDQYRRDEPPEHVLQQAADKGQGISGELLDDVIQSIYGIGLCLESCKPLIAAQPMKPATNTKLKREIEWSIEQLNYVLEVMRQFQR